VSRCQKPAAFLVALCTALVFSPGTHAAPKHTPLPHKAGSRPASAKPKRHAARPHHNPKGRSDAVFPADAEATPAYRYAQLDTESCYDEVRKRQLPLHREHESWPGITAPMRFTGPINGVVFRTDVLESDRATSPYELFDCRLALAIDDFSKLLHAEGISEVVLSSAYRPPPKSTRVGSEQLKRHAGGLAVDVHRFAREDGSWLTTERHSHGHIGAKVCGKSAPPPTPASPEAALLRRVACSAAEQHLFQLVLTPNYDHAHRNHFHLGLTAGVRWFIVS
jgi:hypothetical protein